MTYRARQILMPQLAEHQSVSADMVVPLIAWRGEVERGWIDTNDHMTSMAYPALFHPKIATLFHLVGINLDYITQRRLSVFQREFRLAYERELRLGDRIEIRSWLIDHDEKRIHHFHELWNTEKNYRASYVEYMTFHIDMGARRTGPFPPEVMDRLDALAAAFARVPAPKGVGQTIGIPRKG